MNEPLTETDLRKYLAAMEGAMDGMAILNEHGTYLYLNQAHAAIYGYDSRAELIGKTWRDLYTEAELERFDNVIMPLFMETGRWRGEATGLRKNGSTFPQELSLTALEGGGIICVVRDITDRRRAEQSVKDKLHFIQVLITTIPVPIFYKDAEGRYLGCNSAFEEHICLTREQIVGRTDRDLVPPDQAELFQQLDRSIMETRQVQIQESSLVCADGSRHDVIFYKAPFLNSDGSVGGVAGAILDITERKETEAKLRYLSTHDILTGLYNRAYFDEELERLKKGRTFPVSVVVADVDRLKRVNDLQGHAAGDELLKLTAQVLRGAFRTEDLVARIGGDEFAVILPGTANSATQEVIERIRKNLAEIVGDDGRPILSLSLGCATALDGEGLIEAWQRADELMYEDKLARQEGSRRT
ncbi:MAG: diguanylate cyclase [Geobacter sp.]|nr:MAG: diguanylate cyclase [Geobacter sp.]